MLVVDLGWDGLRKTISTNLIPKNVLVLKDENFLD